MLFFCEDREYESLLLNKKSSHPCGRELSICRSTICPQQKNYLFKINFTVLVSEPICVFTKYTPLLKSAAFTVY
jgi:hypothetical protein